MATNNAVMTTDVKLSRCNNQPWGFRLSGGVDFTFPLTVVRVTIGGLAHKAGLEAGDVVIYVNREPISQLTHMQVHDKLVNIGNDIVLSVVHSHEIAQQQQSDITAPHEDENSYGEKGSRSIQKLQNNFVIENKAIEKSDMYHVCCSKSLNN
ncbi:PREDICTED: PDZ and LIM domain protein 7-like isoform X1 [Cyphomyrmex costatus]|uniref:PDZ and LIM domain protein 7-like isoform X1 n=1 Tax=Cyphomyrmex costatus TaxID=456900 RepID=UPI00085244AD|nr:PREDICTED: PDZ and LIM domain protein 7-like isoform X1 [Cyphomyrmex costatus]